MPTELNEPTEAKQQTLEKYHWGRDALVVLIVASLFYIIVVAIRTPQLDKWIMKNLTNEFMITIFWDWDIWKLTVAILITYLCIQLKHYWKWITIALIILCSIENLKIALDYPWWGSPQPNWMYLTLERALGGVWVCFILFSVFVYPTALGIRLWRGNRALK
ncbi:hypothetical protein AXX12_03340 [Anaerosporomusa subterranea]|uniref:Uncharacterized protein n=1 Tax=Anaerosporomusa subterranea TaxID=1794912 RepID=A0A154BTN1_ANASB|nr:hypothetical protein [Anaerosporomusa subterranea]KYZ77180.1 hypothetical protein AXX12_03340 [Anaerosporomusa subterranea]